MSQSLFTIEQALLLAQQHQSINPTLIDLSSPVVPQANFDALRQFAQHIASDCLARWQTSKPDPILALLGASQTDNQREYLRYEHAAKFISSRAAIINSRLLQLVPSIRPIEGEKPFHAIYRDGIPEAVVSIRTTSAHQKSPDTKAFVKKIESLIDDEVSPFDGCKAFVIERNVTFDAPRMQVKNSNIIVTNYREFFGYYAHDPYLYNKVIICFAQAMIDKALLPKDFDAAHVLNLTI